MAVNGATAPQSNQEKGKAEPRSRAPSFDVVVEAADEVADPEQGEKQDAKAHSRHASTTSADKKGQQRMTTTEAAPIADSGGCGGELGSRQSSIPGGSDTLAASTSKQRRAHNGSAPVSRQSSTAGGSNTCAANSSMQQHGSTAPAGGAYSGDLPADGKTPPKVAECEQRDDDACAEDAAVEQSEEDRRLEGTRAAAYGSGTAGGSNSAHDNADAAHNDASDGESDAVKASKRVYRARSGSDESNYSNPDLWDRGQDDGGGGGDDAEDGAASEDSAPSVDEQEWDAQLELNVDSMVREEIKWLKADGYLAGVFAHVLECACAGQA